MVETTGWPTSSSPETIFDSTLTNPTNGESYPLPWVNLDQDQNVPHRQDLTLFDAAGDFQTFFNSGNSSAVCGYVEIVQPSGGSPGVACDSSGIEPSSYPSLYNGSPISNCGGAPGCLLSTPNNQPGAIPPNSQTGYVTNAGNGCYHSAPAFAELKFADGTQIDAESFYGWSGANRDSDGQLTLLDVQGHWVTDAHNGTTANGDGRSGYFHIYAPDGISKAVGVSWTFKGQIENNEYACSKNGAKEACLNSGDPILLADYLVCYTHSASDDYTPVTVLPVMCGADPTCP